MTKLLQGKVVAVTGAGRGIGRGIAQRIAAEGGRVVVTDFGGALGSLQGGSAAPAAAVVEEIRAQGGKAEACAENIATLSGAQRMVQTALDAYGRLDGLVCAAGLYNHQPLLETTEQQWDDVIASHLKGNFACTQAAARVMIKQRSGSIVNFSSAAAYMTPPLAAAYNTAKAGILGFMRSAALGLHEHGIRVNAVLPGASTRMTDEIFAQWGLATKDVELAAQSRVADTKSGTRTVAKGLGLTSDVAAGTWRDPANVAPFVVFLLSDRAARVNGEAFCVVGFQVTKLRGYSYGPTIRSEGPWNLEDLGRRFDAELASAEGLTPLPWPPP